MHLRILQYGADLVRCRCSYRKHIDTKISNLKRELYYCHTFFPSFELWISVRVRAEYRKWKIGRLFQKIATKSNEWKKERNNKYDSSNWFIINGDYFEITRLLGDLSSIHFCKWLFNIQKKTKRKRNVTGTVALAIQIQASVTCSKLQLNIHEEHDSGLGVATPQKKIA